MRKILICGGRDFVDEAIVFAVLDGMHSQQPITQIIEGGARGADRLGRNWANARGVEVRTFRAKWDQQGRGAGMIRNQRMLEEGKPDQVVAFPGGIGTSHMIRTAKEAGVPVIQPVEISD